MNFAENSRELENHLEMYMRQLDRIDINVSLKDMFLSRLDGKSYIKEDKVTCLPLRHHSIRDTGVFREVL